MTKIADLHSKTAHYVEIRESQVPAGVRFDVPRSNQGQMIEVAYGGFSRAEHGHGDPYMAVTDRSVGPDATKYYVWTERQ